MVAYSFNPRFETAIREGWKTQTIRAARERHALPGEMIQLYVGQHTPDCRKIGPDVRCAEVMKVVIEFEDDGFIERIMTDGVPVRDLEAFAARDGFVDIDDMSSFFRKSHGPIGTFHGVIIEWAAPRVDAP